MRVDLEVALAGQGRGEAAMGRDLVQHVIVEGMPVSILRGPSRVEIDRDGDLRFLGIPHHLAARRLACRLGGEGRSAASAALFSASVPIESADTARRGIGAEADADAERPQLRRERGGVVDLEETGNCRRRCGRH